MQLDKHHNVFSTYLLLAQYNSIFLSAKLSWDAVSFRVESCFIGNILNFDDRAVGLGILVTSSVRRNNPRLLLTILICDGHLFEEDSFLPLRSVSRLIPLTKQEMKQFIIIINDITGNISIIYY